MRISAELSLTDARIVLYLSRNLSLHSCVCILHLYIPPNKQEEEMQWNHDVFHCQKYLSSMLFWERKMHLKLPFCLLFQRSFFYPQILAGNRQHSRMWNFTTRKRIAYNVFKHSVNWEDKNQCNINETFNISGILAVVVCFSSRHMCKMLKKKNICLDEKEKILG